jgi:DNA-binding NarL/FixJ family response regulator
VENGKFSTNWFTIVFFSNFLDDAKFRLTFYMMVTKKNILVTTKNDNDKIQILASISDQNDLQIIDIVDDEANTIIKSANLKPDLLIFDLQPSMIDGTMLAPIIHRYSPSTSIILMSDRDESDYAGISLKAGVSGFLLRETDMDRLLPAIKIVIMGGYYISPPIIKKILETINLIKKFPDAFSKENINKTFFSPVERCVIKYLAEGYSDKEIARKMNYTTGSIKNYLSDIKRKTRLNNRTQIVVYALVSGLISLS